MSPYCFANLDSMQKKGRTVHSASSTVSPASPPLSHLRMKTYCQGMVL